MKTLADAKVAASNLYNATRELPMKAAQHELMGTSHDLLQQFVLDAERQAAEIQDKDKTIETLTARISGLEKPTLGAPFDETLPAAGRATP